MLKALSFHYRLLAPALAGAALTMAVPDVAEACGGTFCDAGPQVMPVDQTGENIVFVYNASTIEAHIQIQYDGEAANFAWVIPVTDVPEIRVGSQAFFDNLLTATVPQFGTQTVFEPCREGPGFGCSDDSLGFANELDDIGGSGTEGGGDGGGGGPDVLARGVAGAFEFSVLEGGTVDGVMAWLGTNGYEQDDEAPPILGEYLDDGYLFVAVKLRSGADVDEIQPLVLEYAGDEPCIPIKLTRIAAVDDMGIRAFFLGTERTVPMNYAHVIVNMAKLDWLNFGDNYGDVVTMAVDEQADGHGFVTEYAGATQIVPRSGIVGPAWAAPRFLQLAAHEVVDELTAQGLVDCGDGTCDYFHPMVEPLLDQYVPLPAGIAPDAFYSCLTCYLDQIDQMAWDPQAFADTFTERIVDPGLDAEEILDRKPYLTRLFTTISPHEMTADPMFHQNGGLGDVGTTTIATQVFPCEGTGWIELPDGTIVHLDEDGAYPDLGQMPAASRVEMVPADGAPMVDTDNGSAINDAIDTWNDENPAGSAAGCGCNSESNAEGPLTMLALFGLVAARRRRRAR